MWQEKINLLFLRGAGSNFSQLSSMHPKRDILRHCGLVPRLRRDRQVLSQELEVSLLVSGLFWAALWSESHCTAGTLSPGIWSAYPVS